MNQTGDWWLFQFFLCTIQTQACSRGTQASNCAASGTRTANTCYEKSRSERPTESSCTDCAKQVLGDERHRPRSHGLAGTSGCARGRPQPRRQSGQLFASTLLLPATARSVFVETGMGGLSYRRVCTVRPMYSGGGRFTQPARRPERRASGADHTSPEATRRVVAAPGRGRRASRLRRPTRVP